ncbi:hypothetical protein KBZ21_51345, partial [Streptomyces sp. A73]|nr:hypothetical protein [Streptomyces sp. A73]
MCSPNGGYQTSNMGKLVGFDVNGVTALLANARAQGISEPAACHPGLPHWVHHIHHAGCMWTAGPANS